MVSPVVLSCSQRGRRQWRASGPGLWSACHAARRFRVQNKHVPRTVCRLCVVSSHWRLQQVIHFEKAFLTLPNATIRPKKATLNFSRLTRSLEGPRAHFLAPVSVSCAVGRGPRALSRRALALAQHNTIKCSLALELHTVTDIARAHTHTRPIEHSTHIYSTVHEV